MAIATLLFSTMLLKFFGKTGMAGMTAAITIGSVICIIASSLRVTLPRIWRPDFWLAATPKKQQIGEMFGHPLRTALATGGALYLLNAAWGYGSAELPAPRGRRRRKWL